MSDNAGTIHEIDSRNDIEWLVDDGKVIVGCLFLGLGLGMVLSHERDATGGWKGLGG